MTDPYAIAGYAFLLALVLWQLKVPHKLWYRYVLQPTGHWWKRRKALWWGRWRPRKQRPPMPQSLRQHIFARDGYRCRHFNRYGHRCSNTAGHGMTLQPDHWLPWHKYPGLFYDPRNLVTMCHVHNYKKRGKIPQHFRDWNDLAAIRAGKPGPIICRAHAMRGVEVQPDPRLVPNPR